MNMPYQREMISTWLCGLIMVTFVVTDSAAVQKLSAKQPNCRRGREYFVNGTCHRCLGDCPEGQMLNKSYFCMKVRHRITVCYKRKTIPTGKNGAIDCFPCMQCPPGTLKTKKTVATYADGMKCLPERNCTEEGLEFIKHTDGVNESECGDCLQGYIRNEHGDCFPCNKRHKHKPRCKALFTTTFQPTTDPTTVAMESATTQHSTRAHGTIANDTKEHSNQPLEEMPDPSHVYGVLGLVLFISLLGFTLLCFQCVWCNLKKKSAAVCRHPWPDSKIIVNTAIQNPIPDDDLETDCPTNTTSLIPRNHNPGLSEVENEMSDEDVKYRNINFLKPAEEDRCRGIKLERRDPYISIVGKKVNRPLKPLYRYLNIPENVTYQNAEIYEGIEKNIPEKEVQILNEWLQLSRTGHTLFELYIALKVLKYNYILHHLIPIIRQCR